MTVKNLEKSSEATRRRKHSTGDSDRKEGQNSERLGDGVKGLPGERKRAIGE